MRAGIADAEARLRARYHVQVEIEARSQAGFLDRPRVETTVRRIFRGDDQLAEGSAVNFLVNVFEDGDTCFGRRPFVTQSEFDRARYLEVFLNETPPSCIVPHDQHSVIEALSEKPQMKVHTEEELAAWQSRIDALMGPREVPPDYWSWVLYPVLWMGRERGTIGPGFLLVFAILILSMPTLSFATGAYRLMVWIVLPLVVVGVVAYGFTALVARRRNRHAR